MNSTHIRVPVAVKEELEKRAGGRPLHQMIQEDFLHEPDMQKLMELKFKAIEEHIGDRLEKLGKAQDTQTELIMGLGRCIEKLQGYARDTMGMMKTVGDRLNDADSRILRNEVAINMMVKSQAAGVNIDNPDRFNAQVESTAMRLESLSNQETMELARQGRDALLNTDVVKDKPELRDYINKRSEVKNEQERR